MEHRAQHQLEIGKLQPDFLLWKEDSSYWDLNGILMGSHLRQVELDCLPEALPRGLQLVAHLNN